MLDSIRQGVGSWAIKILLGLLILSFAVWGIGDIFLGVGANPAVATVGGKEITATEFVRNYQRDVQDLSNRAGRNVTPDEGREFGLVRQTISRMVIQKMLGETAQGYGLSISDGLIRDAVWANEAFQDVTGRFDQNRFLQTLGRNGLSEEEFVNSIRLDLTRDQLLSSISVGTFAPAPLVEPIFKHRQEQRVAELAVIDLTTIAEPAPPEEPALVRFYEENEARYIAPEYRAVTYVWIAPDALIDEIEVTQDELERTYESRLDSYFTAERREAEQLIYESETDAVSARGRIELGESFDAVASSTAAINQGATELGSVEWLDLPEDLGDAIFDLSEGAVSDPFESAFGFHVIRVSSIAPEGTRPLADVREEIESEIKRNRAYDGLDDLVARLEDEMAGGRTLEDAASRVRLTTVSLSAIDRAGRDRQANPVDGIADLERFIETVFTTEVERVSFPQESADGGFFFARVDSVMPEAARPLAEIREGVILDWALDHKQQQARQQAEAMLAAANAGRSLTELAAENGARIVKSAPLTRSSGRVQPEVSASLVDQLFGGRIGGHVMAATAGGDGFAIARLDEVIEATNLSDNVALAQLREALNSSIAQDILAQYQIALQEEVGVSVNQGLLDTINLNGIPSAGGGGGAPRHGF
jgi:peptidyl-prolyl cis-trans isomerase D